MKKIIKTSIFIFVLIFYFCKNVDAQFDIKIQNVDKKSYEQFLKKNWNALIKTGNSALKNDIDFYYLRYRLGIAYFEKKNYAKAIIHFENIFKDNKDDALLNEYLYFSYKFCGRKDDAEIISYYFSDDLKKKLKVKNPIIKNVSFGITYLFNNEKDDMLNIDIDGTENIYGEQITMDNQTKYSFGFEHKLFSRIRFNYLFNTTKYNTIQSISDNEINNNFNLQNSQNQYYINANIHPANGFDINIAFNFLDIKGTNKVINYNSEISDLIEYETLEIYDTVYNETATLEIYDTVYNYIETITSSFSDNDFTQNDYIFSAKISKNFSIFRASIFGTYSQLNDYKHKQIGTEFIIYPFGNLNLYSATKLINKSSEETNSWILTQTTGIKLTKNIWTELYFSFGDMNNYVDYQGAVVYNTGETTKKQIGISCIFSLYKNKLNLSANYLLLQNESQYLRYIFEKEELEDFVTTIHRKYTYENDDEIYWGEPEQITVTKTTPIYQQEYVERSNFNHVFSVKLTWNF